MNTKLKRVAAVAFTMAGIAGVTSMTSPPATAAMCMVDCWTEDGGWAGGGGLGGNPNTGTGGGGSDGGRVGSGGYEGPNLDRYAPSGNGWNDSRLPKPRPVPRENKAGAGQAPVGADPKKGSGGPDPFASVLSTNIDDIDPPDDLTSLIEALKRAQRARDNEFADPTSTQGSREHFQQRVDDAEEAVNRASNARYQQVCATKAYLPHC